jgi:hypothetical protein
MMNISITMPPLFHCKEDGMYVVYIYPTMCWRKSILAMPNGSWFRRDENRRIFSFLLGEKDRLITASVSLGDNQDVHEKGQLLI